MSSYLFLLLLMLGNTVDAFITSMVYGIGNIKISKSSFLVIACINTVLFTISIQAGNYLLPYLPESWLKIVCFLVFLFLGIIKLFDSFFKNQIKKAKGKLKKVKFQLFHLQFILQIYANPQLADIDHSDSISLKEAMIIAVALSLDGITTGFLSNLSISIFTCFIIIFIGTLFFLLLGYFLGYQLKHILKRDYSFLSGIFFILFAFLKYWLS